MMKKFTLLLIFLISFAGFSQTVLEDFESTLPASALVEDLGTTVTVVPDPATSGTNGNVLKVVTSAGAGSQTYQNAQYFFQNDGLDLSTTNKVVTIDVYSEIATSILVKVEDAIGGAVAKQTDASHDGAGWQTLSFNFDTANAVYGRLVIFPLWNGVDDFDTKSVTTTYYDNITGIAYAPPAQNITVSVDISETAGGVTIRVYNAELEGFDEIAATIDPNDSNKFSHTFPAGVTSATYAWRLYPSATPTDESLVSLVGGGAVENNLAAFLGDNNGIDTDYANYCSRTVTSTTGNYVAPTFYFNSFRQVGVEYTKLVLTAAQGSNIVIDYSLNEFDESHGPGATDNGDGTYTAIVNPTSTFEYIWNNLTTSTQEDLLTCTNGIGVNTDNANYANRTHAAGEDKADTFNVCPSNAQTITVSVDVSEFDGDPGVNIAVYNGTGFDEYTATVDTTNPKKFNYTFADGVTTATYYWVTYTGPFGVGESLVSLVGGGAIENNLAATLGANNGIASDYGSYCNRTVTSDTGVYVAPTFYHNSFRQVGVTYTELVLTAASGGSYAIDYSINNFDQYHGPGATDNGDGTYTVIVDPSSTFEYMWNNLTVGREDLLSCTDGVGVNTDNTTYANRTHAAGENKADTYNVCPVASQTITVSVDVSEFDGSPGVTIAVYNGTSFDEIPATVDPNDGNKFSHTFDNGVTTATYYWVTYTGQNGVGESLVSLVGGGAIENNLAATLGANNGIASDYGSYCNRTVTSDTGVYVAPTFYHNSFRQVGVTYTELVLTAASGGSYAIDYSINNFDQYHGPGATDNGDGTYTVIVDPSSTFEYMWNNLTVGREDLLSCTDGVGVNTDNTTYANRTHAAGADKADTFNVCPLVPEDPAPQNVVQDFETGTDGLGEGFGGAVAEIVADPETGGTRGQVAKLTAAATGEVWQGININIESNVQLTTDKTMRLDVYSETAISIAPRVQGGVANAPTSTGVVSHTGSGWETLTVTFNTGSNGDATAEGEYSEFVIYYLWDNGFIAPAIDRVMYVDNITGIIAKTLVQDFETGTDGLGEGFGGAVAEIVADPETGGTRGQVAKLTAAATGEVWQGININIESNVQLTTDKTMRLDVYSETAISIAPRVQGGVANAPTSTGVVSHTGSGWETLTVTFNTGSNGDATAEGEYAEFVIYYLWDNGFIAPAVDRIFYVDNIKGISTEAAVDTSLPTTAAPSPTNSDVTILSIYNDTGSFTGISQVWPQEYDFGTNQGNKDLDPTEGVNNALKMDFSATGYGAGAAVTDISNQTHLHFDYYAPAGDAGVNGHEFKFIIIGDGQGEKDYFFKTSGGDAVIEFDQWVSIDIPLSHYEALGFTKDKFLQYKLGSTSDLNTKVVYFDNIYFYNDANLGLDSSNAFSMSLYPSPAKNELKISAENKIDTASIYNILGRKVKSFSVNAKTSSLDVSSLSTGIYILKYTSNNVVGSMKFIKE